MPANWRLWICTGELPAAGQHGSQGGSASEEVSLGGDNTEPRKGARIVQMCPAQPIPAARRPAFSQPTAALSYTELTASNWSPTSPCAANRHPPFSCPCRHVLVQPAPPRHAPMAPRVDSSALEGTRYAATPGSPSQARTDGVKLVDGHALGVEAVDDSFEPLGLDVEEGEGGGAAATWQERKPAEL